MIYQCKTYYENLIGPNVNVVLVSGSLFYLWSWSSEVTDYVIGPLIALCYRAKLHNSISLYKSSCLETTNNKQQQQQQQFQLSNLISTGEYCCGHGSLDAGYLLVTYYVLFRGGERERNPIRVRWWIKNKYPVVSLKKKHIVWIQLPICSWQIYFYLQNISWRK